MIDSGRRKENFLEKWSVVVGEFGLIASNHAQVDKNEFQLTMRILKGFAIIIHVIFK